MKIPAKIAIVICTSLGGLYALAMVAAILRALLPAVVFLIDILLLAASLTWLSYGQYRIWKRLSLTEEQRQ